MKNMKNIYIGKFAFVMAMAIIAASCQQDEVVEQYNPKPQGDYISFNIKRGWDFNEGSRNADSEYGKHMSKHILVSEDKSEYQFLVL